MNFLAINGDRMLFSLQYMWKGMLCIFIVTGVLIATVYLLNKLGKRKDQDKNQKNQ